MSIKDKADEFINKSGIIEILQKYGKVYIVGSYTMDVMTWNDLDIYLDRCDFRHHKYCEILAELVRVLSPIRFNGILKADQNLMFIGLETELSGERWNLDIWWKDKSEIDSAIAYSRELMCKMENNPEYKKALLRIKQELIKCNLYGFDKGKIHYHSNEIYSAVFDKGVRSTEQFLKLYSKE